MNAADYLTIPLLNVALADTSIAAGGNAVITVEYSIATDKGGEPSTYTLTGTSRRDGTATDNDNTVVTPIAVTAANFVWLQVHGPVAVLLDGTVVIGDVVVASNATDGAVEAMDIVLSEGTPNTMPATTEQPHIGIVMAVNATAEYGGVFLTIE